MIAAPRPASPLGLLSASVALLALGACYASHARPHDVARDAGLDPGRRDSGRDASASSDAGPPPSCAAQDARLVCAMSGCTAAVPAWHWNGYACFASACGFPCEGSDCDASYATQSACEAAHASCEPILCSATGGDWHFWGEECGHYVCGRPVPAICEVGFPICDCGPGRIFDETRGCVGDPVCAEEDPPPLTREGRCTSTRGVWGGFCCDSDCGVRCGDDCTAPACDCGPGRVFDEARGCLEVARCFETSLVCPLAE